MTHARPLPEAAIAPWPAEPAPHADPLPKAAPQPRPETASKRTSLGTPLVGLVIGSAAAAAALFYWGSR
jgi:hypothetical protein